MWFLLAFLAVPLIEIALFIQVGSLIGLWPTLAIVVLTAIVGTTLMRSQGALALAQVRRSFSDLHDPTEPLAHGAMILVAGVLLLTPGFFTDACGLALLTPPVRDAVFRFVRARVNVQGFQVGGSAHPQRGPADPGRRPSGPGASHSPRGDVIDADFEDIEQTSDTSSQAKRPTHRGSGWTKH